MSVNVYTENADGAEILPGDATRLFLIGDGLAIYPTVTINGVRHIIILHK